MYIGWEFEGLERVREAMLWKTLGPEAIRVKVRVGDERSGDTHAKN